ncbi:pentatricopeptide repeat-containing protein At4g16835, mitochondrial-like [Cryptomeria japonica]|uniref:pentatricopeptide repeat-containing protein At4g16835, mitochondrial-like n=1 Tax=Cryptomeria japonica TaxID=3369 RepID=UPI0027DA87A5|nr:pentatricopeptide repeat-containing protein At4g16835, mitochondrial-like [Cryptomeria japonica]
MGSLEQGMDNHQSINDRGIFPDVVFATALVDVYATYGSKDKAHELFEKVPQKNVVLWNAMIAEYAQNGSIDKNLEMVWLDPSVAFHTPYSGIPNKLWFKWIKFR